MMSRNRILRTAGQMVAAIALVTTVSASAQQRDPAYAAARKAGQVGERMDGYLGIVGNQGPDIRRLVEDLNLKRKAIFFAKAEEKKVTPDEYAFTTGCVNILNTDAGEKYQAPDGTWKTRGAEAPVRHPSCP